MQPLPPEMIAGLGALAQPLPTAAVPPAVPAPPPVAPAPSLSDLYIRARMQGMDDTKAALALAQHLREQADLRSTFHDAGNIAAGRPQDPGYRTQLMGEADRPLLDLAARRATAPLAAEEVGRQADIAGKDIALQQQRGLLDPNHPTNVATRAILAKAGVNVQPNTIAPALPKDLWEQIRPLVEAGSKSQELAALAPGRAATAAREQAQAASIAGPETAKLGAETEEAAAKAAVERQKVGPQVAPGWTRTGTVANISDKEIEDFRTQTTGASESERITKELTGILGKHDFPTSTKKIARAAVLAGKLLAAGKTSMGIRGLPANDVQYLQSMQGDLSAGNPKNWLNLNQNVTRLKELNRNVQAELEAQGKTLGLQKAGSTATAGTVNAATHYLVSPDGKTRIPADASGKPLAGAKEEPNLPAGKVPNA